MNVMITGSRGWKNGCAIQDRLDALPTHARLMQGGAKGADLIAADWAHRHGRVCRQFSPDWNRPSPERYHERNDAMLKEADLVLAFWDGSSPGTKSVIKKARDQGIPVEVISP